MKTQEMRTITINTEFEHIKSQYAIFDKEDNNECVAVFEEQDDARDFCINENAGFGYQKYYYKEIE